MGTEVKPDALPDLDDLLQCPVCYEIPTGQIFQCNEGHHVCGRCKSRLAQCPVCRALFFGTRNYAMEELIANVRKLQAFKLGGKMTITSGSESTASADNSVVGANLDGSVEEEEADDSSGTTSLRAPAACKGLFRCLCCKSGNSERLPSGRLLNHLRYFHGRDLLEGKSEGGEYVQAWQIATVPGRIVIAVRVVDMGVFFLVIEINSNSIYAWVSMAAAPWVAHVFNYTVTISGNDREAIFSDSVWSVRSCEGTLKKRGRCLIVQGADVRALTAATAVSGRLALRRAPTDQLALPTQPRAVLRVANRGSQAQPPPRDPIAPFLQGLHDDVARLSRALGTLGREANALARSEAEVRARIENENSANGSIDPPEPEPEPQVNDVRLSRNARRRMRQRLRAALNESEPTSTQPARPTAQAPIQHQQREIVQSSQRPQVQPQQSAQTPAQPRSANQPQHRAQPQPQHLRVGYLRVVESPQQSHAQPAATAAHSGPSNGLPPTGNERSNNNNKKKRRNQRR